MRMQAKARLALFQVKEGSDIAQINRSQSVNGKMVAGGAILFWISALLATLVCYDPQTSVRAFGLLTLGLLGGGAVVTGRVPVKLIAWTAFGLGVGLALYFIFQNDFEQRSKFALVRWLSTPFQGLLPDLGGHKPHPNIAAGGLEIALPFYVVLATQNQKWIRALAAGGAVVTVFALLLTESRGAWLALGLSSSIAGLIYMLQRSPTGARPGWLMPILVGTFVVGGLGLAWVIRETLLHPALIGSIGDRLTLQRQALQLAGDYLVTGAGLGVFEPTYAQYILFHNAPPEPHAHNIWLDLLIAQGLVGILAYAFITLGILRSIIRVVRSNTNLLPIWWASLIAWSTMLMHGIGDDVHYESVLLPLILIVPAVYWRATPCSEVSDTLPSARARIGARSVKMAAVLAIGTALLIGNQIWISVAEANWGNLAQARIDLGKDNSPTTREIADQALTAAWHTWPQNPSSVRRAAFFYLTANQIDRAIAYHSATGASVDVWPGIARDLMYHYPGAKWQEIDQAAIAEKTTIPSAYYVVAESAANAKDWTTAITMQQQGLTRDSNPPVEAYINLGDWLQAAGDYTRALDSYKQAAHLAPGKAEIQQRIDQVRKHP